MLSSDAAALEQTPHARLRAAVDSAHTAVLTTGVRSPAVATWCVLRTHGEMPTAGSCVWNPRLWIPLESGALTVQVGVAVDQTHNTFACGM